MDVDVLTVDNNTVTTTVTVANIYWIPAQREIDGDGERREGGLVGRKYKKNRILYHVRQVLFSFIV